MNAFPKTKRLLKKHEYAAVFEKAVRLTTSEFTLLYRRNEVGHARLGLAISKKAIAKAHDRNRIKRLLRETFRKISLPDFDIVVLAKPGVGKIVKATLIQRLNKTWSKLLDHA